jgi:hypothetical protein
MNGCELSFEFFCAEISKQLLENDEESLALSYFD